MSPKQGTALVVFVAAALVVASMISLALAPAPEETTKPNPYGGLSTKECPLTGCAVYVLSEDGGLLCAEPVPFSEPEGFRFEQTLCAQDRFGATS